jgi:hypothetical protein
VDYYIHKLFDDISPVEDITGGKLNVTISNIAVGEALDDIETCKKKEMTYGGIITGKITLIDNEHVERIATKTITLPEMQEVPVAADTIYKKDKDSKILKTALVKKGAIISDDDFAIIQKRYSEEECNELIEREEQPSGKDLTIAQKGDLLTSEQRRAVSHHYKADAL